MRYNKAMETIYNNKNSIIFRKEYQDLKVGFVETQNFVIIQVADSYYNSHFCIPSHEQCCQLEITFPLTNGLVCSTDGKQQNLKKNEIYLSFENDNHELSSNRGCRFQTLAVNVKSGEYSNVFTAIKDIFASDRVCSLQEISGLFSAIISEIVVPDAPFSLSYLDNLIASMLIKLSRANYNPKEINYLSTVDTLPAIVNYIDSHFLEMCSLDELSSYFGYNYGHICKTFRKRYGVTPLMYLNSKKMSYAEKLLGEGTSIKSVSEQLGYSSPYNFSRAFKKHYGVSPTTHINSKK